MKITREFCPGDRYIYDFGLCSYGAARIDPGCDPAMKAAFEGLGLADMLH